MQRDIEKPTGAERILKACSFGDVRTDGIIRAGAARGRNLRKLLHIELTAEEFLSIAGGHDAAGCRLDVSGNNPSTRRTGLDACGMLGARVFAIAGVKTERLERIWSGTRLLTQKTCGE